MGTTSSIWSNMPFWTPKQREPNCCSTLRSLQTNGFIAWLLAWVCFQPELSLSLSFSSLLSSVRLAWSSAGFLQKGCLETHHAHKDQGCLPYPHLFQPPTGPTRLKGFLWPSARCTATGEPRWDGRSRHPPKQKALTGFEEVPFL